MNERDINKLECLYLLRNLKQYVCLQNWVMYRNTIIIIIGMTDVMEIQMIQERHKSHCH